MKRKKIEDSRLYRIIDDVKHKLCSICEMYKPMNSDNFSQNNKNKKDGFYPYCKPCNSKKSRQWEIDNPEKYRALNKTKIPSKHPKRLERLRNFRKTDHYKEYMTEWRSNNKDKTAAYSFKRSQNKTHDITEKQWLYCKGYFDNRCVYCGLHVDEHFRNYAGKLQKIDLHKDHADHTGSNKIDNCIPSCLNCNASKHDKDLIEWYSTYNEHFSKERLTKILKWLNDDWMIAIGNHK